MCWLLGLLSSLRCNKYITVDLRLTFSSINWWRNRWIAILLGSALLWRVANSIWTISSTKWTCFNTGMAVELKAKYLLKIIWLLFLLVLRISMTYWSIFKVLSIILIRLLKNRNSLNKPNYSMDQKKLKKDI